MVLAILSFFLLRVKDTDNLYAANRSADQIKKYDWMSYASIVELLVEFFLMFVYYG